MSNEIKEELTGAELAKLAGAFIGSYRVEEVWRGGLPGWGLKQVRHQWKTSPGYYLITYPRLANQLSLAEWQGTEEFMDFFREDNDYAAYVHAYRNSDSLPYQFIVRKLTPIEFVPVTDDDNALPSYLKVSFIKTTQPEEGFGEQLYGLIAYALAETFRGTVAFNPKFKADFDDGNHWWDCELQLQLTKEAARTEHPDLGLALSTARFYIERGTPLRSTNRAGQGTKGTRAVNPLPELKGVRFNWFKAD